MVTCARHSTYNISFTLRSFLNIPISLIATIVASLQRARTLAMCVNAGDKETLTVFLRQVLTFFFDDESYRVIFSFLLSALQR